jgi:TRAP-type C4-dicarboxylate transport system permease small subunit
MRLVNGAATALAALAILAMAGITAAEVIARSFLGLSFEVADELGGYLLVATVFLGLGPAFAADAMLKVEMVEQRLPGGLRRVLAVLFHLAALVVSGIMLFWIWRHVASTLRRETVAATWLETPLWLPQLAMPVGMVLLIAAIAFGLARLLRRGGADGAP